MLKDISNINDNLNNLIAENYYLKNILISTPLLYQRLQNPFLMSPLADAWSKNIWNTKSRLELKAPLWRHGDKWKMLYFKGF